MGFDDIQVTNVHPETGVITLGLQPKRLKGISKLVQVVVLSILNSPGQDVLDFEKGSGLGGYVGANIESENSTELLSHIALSITKTEKEVLAAQIGLDEDPEELLKELHIVDIRQGGNIDEYYVIVRVINEAGQTADILV